MQLDLQNFAVLVLGSEPFAEADKKQGLHDGHRWPLLKFCL